MLCEPYACIGNMLGFLFLWLITAKGYVGAYDSLRQVPDHFYPFGPQDDQNPVDITWSFLDGPHLRQILPQRNPMLFLGHEVIEIMEEEGGGILLYNVTHQIRYDGFHAPLFHDERDIGKVFPFSSVIDLNMGGHITYRFVDSKSDPRLLKLATHDVRRAFPYNKRFKPSAVIIVTWYNVNYFQKTWYFKWVYDLGYCAFEVVDYCCDEGIDHYGFLCTGDYKRSVGIDHQRVFEQTDKEHKRERKVRKTEFEDNRQNIDDIDTSLGLNTFQTVFIYNRFHTHVMFNYGEINWIRSDGRPRNYDIVGGSASAFIQSADINYTLPVSGTEEMRNIEESTNCGVPGRYMFKVDSATGVKQPSCC